MLICQGMGGEGMGGEGLEILNAGNSLRKTGCEEIWGWLGRRGAVIGEGGLTGEAACVILQDV